MLIATVLLLVGFQGSASAKPTGPACDPGVPPSLKFKSLPTGIYTGYEHLFGFQHFRYGATLDEPIYVEMVGREGYNFYEGPTTLGEVGDDVFYVQLDPGDQYVTIRATYAENTGGRCVRTIEQRVNELSYTAPVYTPPNLPQIPWPTFPGTVGLPPDLTKLIYGDSTSGNEPAGGKASPLRLSDGKVGALSRRVLNKVFGDYFYWGKGYRRACSKPGSPVSTCQVKWRTSRFSYAGTLGFTRTSSRRATWVMKVTKRNRRSGAKKVFKRSGTTKVSPGG